MKKLLSITIVLIMLLGLIPTVVAEETKNYKIRFFQYDKYDSLYQLDYINFSNTKTEINEGDSYITKLSPKINTIEIDTLVVVMGENTPVYPTKNGDGSYLINIPKVSGDICIAVSIRDIGISLDGGNGYNYYITNLSHVSSKHCKEIKENYPEITTTQIKPCGTYVFNDVFTPDEGYEIVDFKVTISDNYNEYKHEVTSEDSIITKNEDGSYKIIILGGSSIYVTAVAEPIDSLTITKPSATASTKPENVEVKNISLNNTQLILNKGTFATLRAVVTPTNAKNKAVTWKSSNTKVARVTSSGDVLAVGRGNCIITATSKSNSKIKATCKVTVRQPVTKVQLRKTTVKVKLGRTYTLKAKVTPTNANNKHLIWKSNKPKIAKVNQNGQVKTLKKGTAVITVRAKDGSNKFAKCTVMVTKV